MKLCSKCHEPKPDVAFSMRGNGRVASECRACKSARDKRKAREKAVNHPLRTFKTALVFGFVG